MERQHCAVTLARVSPAGLQQAHAQPAEWPLRADATWDDTIKQIGEDLSALKMQVMFFTHFVRPLARTVPVLSAPATTPHADHVRLVTPRNT